MKPDHNLDTSYYYNINNKSLSPGFSVTTKKLWSLLIFRKENVSDGVSMEISNHLKYCREV